MKKIEVVAAIIKKDGKYLATRRGYGKFKGGWEFPGGKIEIGESQEEALIREIKEELDAEIKIEKHFMTVEYDYKSFYLIMHCYICSLIDEEIKLIEHSDEAWLKKSELKTIDWLPADIEIIDALIDEREEVASYSACNKI